MKKTNIILYTLLSFLTFISCDAGFEELNTDSNNSVAVPAHLLLGGSQRIYMNSVYSVQRGGDMGACWAQHWSKVQYNDEARYIPRRGLIDGLWNTMYTNVIAESKAMYELAVVEENTNLQGVALVMQAIAFQTLTDMFGPVPFTEASDPSNLKPAYDSEEIVYQGVIDLLTQADVLFSSGEGEIVASSDLFYEGNSSKWKKLANSLKFRALMRISSTKDVSSELQALMGKLLASNDDSAQLVYLEAPADANPIFRTIDDGNRAEYKINSVFVKILEDLNDDRLEVMAGENEDGNILGKPSGYGLQTTLPNEDLGYTYANISPLGDFYLEPTLPGVLMSYSQLCFLIAEAANEGYITGGLPTALEWYKKGITANFTFNGLKAKDYLLQSGIEFTTQEDARSKIATQEWIALFGQGLESWTEWRRNKIPLLDPAIEGNISEIPSRFYYPTTEPSLNKENYNAAVQLVGKDNLQSPLFWQ